LSENEERPTLRVEGLWSRQDWYNLAANKINCGLAKIGTTWRQIKSIVVSLRLAQLGGK